MNAKVKTISITIALSLFVLSACVTQAAQPVAATAIPTAANIANPASAYCKEPGNRLEIRTAADGSQWGVCVFADGSQCEEWAYFKKECTSASQDKAVEMVRIKLASQLKVEGSTLHLVSAEATSWPDTCLAIPQAGETCDHVVTPGFRIILSSAGKNYIYHTNVSASMLRQEPS